MELNANPELVIYMDTCTGEIKIEKIFNDTERTVLIPDSVRQFRTGLMYDIDVAAKIRLALDRKGVKVKGVSGKCINISKDWLVQILVLLYYGLCGPEIIDPIGYLKQFADLNSEWKNNTGIELQKQKEKEYWNKVEQYRRKKHDYSNVDQSNNLKSNNLKILIVDDDALSSEFMLLLCSSLGKCDVARNGLEAIEAFMISCDARENYDLITLDVMMPIMSGQEVLKCIRTIEEARGLDATKIIMITAKNEVTDIMDAFKDQCDGYLVKPVDSGRLTKLLCELYLKDYISVTD